MTCKDCIHNEKCALIWFCEFFGASAGICDRFQDKSKIIELPCKIGDKIYAILGDGTPPSCVEEGKVFKITLTRDGAVWLSASAFDGFEINRRIDDIGKTVFLTREEAEKALNKA